MAVRLGRNHRSGVGGGNSQGGGVAGGTTSAVSEDGLVLVTVLPRVGGEGQRGRGSAVEGVTPPLLLTCHWTVGVGVPLAAAVKVTELPVVIVWLFGCVVTTGACWRQ